jgi:hypothetical protein
MLSIAQESRLSAGLSAALFAPMGTPTRRLLGLPFFLASATPQPVLFLQLFYGCVWLAIGWAAARLTKSLFPGASRTAWLAGALTVTATSDVLTNSLVATGYNVCVLLGLLALDSGVRFVRGARPAWLLCAVACALGSVYTIDGAAVALALAPLLFLVAAGGLTARALLAGAAWGAALVPYGLTTLAGFRDPSSYLAVAARSMPPVERLTRTFILAANNVLPWQWALQRTPLFGEAPPHVLPAWLAIAAAAAGLAILRHGSRHAGEDEDAEGAPRPGLVLAWLAAAALLSNAAYAAVQLSEYFYRTHLLTRVLTSIVIAWAAGRLLARRDRGRFLGGVLAGTFLACGVAGGIERQDYYLSSWRRHRAELSSIVDQVPRTRPDTEILLVLPSDPAFQAMKVTYLARRWTTLLYPDRRFRPLLSLWAPDAGTACEAEAGGFRCREYEEQDCFAKGTCPGRKLAWEKTIVLTYDPAASRFTLEDEIRESLLGGKAGPGDSYRPRMLVLPGGPDPRLGGILVPERGLARFVP